jgi:hypothetical protein
MDTNDREDRVAALAARFAKGKELFREGDAPPDDEGDEEEGNGKHATRPTPAKPEPPARRGAEPLEVGFLRDAAELLTRLNVPLSGGLRVRISSGDGLVYKDLAVPRVPEHECPGPPSAPPEDDVPWLWLSPAEEAVVRALRGQAGEWVTSGQLAREADRELDGGFKGMLRNMVDRAILKSSQGRGYRLCE